MLKCVKEIKLVFTTKPVGLIYAKQRAEKKYVHRVADLTSWPPIQIKSQIEGKNVSWYYGLEKLSQNRTASNAAEKACGKLFKPSHNCSKVKTVTDSQTKAVFYSFHAWF